MGLYINPRNMEKETWLRKHGDALQGAPSNFRTKDKVAICLVDNGAFTAAGVAFDQRELEDLTRFDGRRKLWFMAPIAEVEAVTGFKFKENSND